MREPEMRGRRWIMLGAISAAVAVAAGAIGTHVLKETLKLPDDKLQTFEVAVRYQMAHSLGLILAGMLADHYGCRWISIAAVAMLLGILLFSGGLYAWLFTSITPLVHVVPFGGLAWIVAWLLLAYGVVRSSAHGP